MNDKEFLIKYENLLNKGYCDCNEMNCIDNNSPRRILNIAIKQQKEIERLNNIINELTEYKYAVYKIKQYISSYNPYFIDTQEDNNKKIANIINEIGNKELKDSD